MEANATFWAASCTKLLTTIAALQCVERGQIALDESVSKVLPELAEPQIISSVGDGTSQTSISFMLRPAAKNITLWHLLTNTSGIAYDMVHPELLAWRASRGESPMGLSGKVIEAFSVPLLCEPGEKWIYGGGYDWAGVLVCRLNGGITLEEYMQQHLFQPLGMKTTTFRAAKHTEITTHLAAMSQRQEDGSFQPAQSPWPIDAEEDSGGAGIYSSVPDYMKVLADLISDNPIILKKETVDLMCTPQITAESAMLKDPSVSQVIATMTGISDISAGVTWSLGSVYMTEDVGVMKKNTLVWGGMANLVWFANRERGVAGIFASQLLPPGDAKCFDLALQFIDHIFSLASSK